MLPRIAGALTVLSVLTAFAYAVDLQVDGDLEVSGDADIQGSTLTLGSWDGLQTPGMAFLYDEDEDTGVLLWRASRFSAEWRFQHERSGGPTFDAVAIDSSHRLIVYGTDSGNSAQIILDPQSTSSFGTSINFLGSDNQMPNQAILGPGSVLTAGMADGRYLRSAVLLSGTQNHVLGLDRATGTTVGRLTVQAGSAPEGSSNKSGGTLVLASGISTGGAGSSIEFKTSGNTVSGSDDRELITRMRINGLGAVGVGSGALGGHSSNSFGGIDISWGGTPSSLIVGAEINTTLRRSGYDKIMRISMPPHFSTSFVHHVLEGTTGSVSSSLSLGRSFTDVFLKTTTTGTTDSPVTRIQLDRTGVITFNPDAAQNTAFRVKGNTDTNLLFVRGTTDRIGIGTSTPAAKLHVAGGSQIDGSLLVSGTTTIRRADITENLVISNTGSLTLPGGVVLSASNSLHTAIASGTVLMISGTISSNQIAGLSAVASTGSYNSLSGLPTIPTDTNQLTNGAGYITASGTASFAEASGTASALSGTIQATQVANLSAVATSGSYSSLAGLPTIPTDTTQLSNGAGYLTSSGTASGITLSGTTRAEGIIVAGGVVVTGTAVQVTSGTTTITKIVAAGNNSLVLIPEQGDLSMGTFTAGAVPQ